MLDQLLLTKLYVPRVHASLVARPRLAGKLEEGMGCKLTLISAPAGFGKTTLLGEWRMLHLKEGRALAWVSLDEGDNDPARFLSYLVAALREVCEVCEGIGQNARVLGSPEPPPVQEILTGLINEVTKTPYDFALILDDYHLIENPTVHEAVCFLLDHLPPPMHLIIASRTDPPLSIPRLRVRGQFMEIRAKDLRFQPEEAARFLKGVMGLELAARDVAELEARTEGWIAGLQLAAHAMRGRRDVSGFINALDSHPHILDYLTEEVFQGQPESIQSFLLETSILERMNGPLCEAVTGRSGAGRRWRGWRRPTSLPSRWMRSGVGTVTITSSLGS